MDQPLRIKQMRRSVGLAFVTVLAVSPESASALSNPASVFCVQSGGKSEMRNGPQGQRGFCRLPDGRVVDEWAYFRKMRAKARGAL
jgi:uncharacterized protein